MYTGMNMKIGNVNTVLEDDIMHFAGLALICFGLFKLAKMKPWMMFAIAFTLSLASSIIILTIGQFMTGNLFVDAILSLFLPVWYAKPEYYISCFPLVNYLIFPVAGYCFSFYYKKLKNKNMFFGIALGLALITIAAYCLINPPKNLAGLFREDDIGYYHIYTWDALVNIITSTGLIGICYFASLILPNFAKKGCAETSKNINKIYCISWVLTINGIYLYFLILLNKGINYDNIEVPDWISILIGIGIFIISALIAHYYVKARKLIKDKRKPKEVSTN